jgi:hypothetical protein
MVITNDTMFLFSGNELGTMVKHSIPLKSISKTYQHYHQDSIDFMIKTQNDKFLFTSDRSKNMKQFSILTNQCTNDYGRPHKEGIGWMVPIPDDSYIFTGKKKNFSPLTNLKIKVTKTGTLCNGI